MCQSTIQDPNFKVWGFFTQIHRSNFKRCYTHVPLNYHDYKNISHTLVITYFKINILSCGRLWSSEQTGSSWRLFRNLSNFKNLPRNYSIQFLMQNFFYYSCNSLSTWSFISIPRSTGVIRGFETRNFAPKQSPLSKKEYFSECVSILLHVFPLLRKPKLVTQ